MLDKFYGLLLSFSAISMFFKLGMTDVAMTAVVGSVVIYKLCYR